MERENKEDEIKVETIQGISFSDINIFDKPKTGSIGPIFFKSPIKEGRYFWIINFMKSI